MITKTDAPRRACRLILDLEADDRASIIGALENITTRIDRGEMSSGSSGGYSSGHIYTYTESDTPTHDEFVDALRRYLLDVESRHIQGERNG